MLRICCADVEEPAPDFAVWPSQQLAAASRTDRDGGRFCSWVRLGRGRRIVVFVAEPAVASVVPVSLLVSMVWRVSTRTVDCCLEHERQTSNLLGPPRGGRFGWLREGVSDGSEPQPVRRDGCVGEGRQGLCPGRRSGAAEDGGDGPDLGGDDEPSA